MTRIDERLQPYVANRLDPVNASLVTGIVGDEPSKYAKTPHLWNAVFREFAWDAVSLAWDVAPTDLGQFVRAMREADEVAGFSVTVPYKVTILPLLDELDPIAERIGAINTVERRPDGRLVGSNTDGQGAVDALTRKLPGMDRAFLEGLEGRNVLLIGAGGAARGVAFYIASLVGPGGTLRIVNRTVDKAEALAASVRTAYGLGEGGGEDRISEWLPDADLVVNATVKGQSGWRKAAAGSSLVEPYSSLAPADPAVVPSDAALDGAAARQWFLASKADLQRNLLAGLDAVARLKPSAACFDLVYSPLETRFLRDARIAGHATLNGKWMNVGQAADAFARRVLRTVLDARGLGGDRGYDKVFDVMVRVW